MRSPLSPSAPSREARERYAVTKLIVDHNTDLKPRTIDIVSTHLPSFVNFTYHHAGQEAYQPVSAVLQLSANRSTASRAKSGSRPPSLKELSERLTTSSSSSALSEITSSTNLPSSDSRLKLPPSAVARANLTPSPPPRTAKNDENTRVDVDTGAKDTKEDDKSGDGKSDTGKTLSRHSSTATLKNSEAGDEASDGTRATNSLALSIGGESEPSPTPTPSKPTKTDGTATDETKSGVYKPKQLDELRHNKARASLGHGFPGFGLGPETPSRLKEEVPSIIVQRSTPGQSPGKEVEEGTRSGRASPSMPPSPRSLANGLPLEHAWWVTLWDASC